MVILLNWHMFRHVNPEIALVIQISNEWNLWSDYIQPPTS